MNILFLDRTFYEDYGDDPNKRFFALRDDILDWAGENLRSPWKLVFTSEQQVAGKSKRTGRDWGCPNPHSLRIDQFRRKNGEWDQMISSTYMQIVFDSEYDALLFKMRWFG
jgi:hypothetical protein